MHKKWTKSHFFSNVLTNYLIGSYGENHEEQKS